RRKRAAYRRREPTWATPRNQKSRTDPKPPDPFGRPSGSGRFYRIGGTDSTMKGDAMRNTRLVSLGALLCCLSVAMPMPMSAQPSDVVQDPKAADFGPSNLTHVRVAPFEFQAVSAIAGDRVPGPGWTFYGSGD